MTNRVNRGNRSKPSGAAHRVMHNERAQCEKYGITDARKIFPAYTFATDFTQFGIPGFRVAAGENLDWEAEVPSWISSVTVSTTMLSDDAQPELAASIAAQLYALSVAPWTPNTLYASATYGALDAMRDMLRCEVRQYILSAHYKTFDNGPQSHAVWEVCITSEDVEGEIRIRARTDSLVMLMPLFGLIAASLYR